jgi:hypothetical protein
LAGCFPLIHVWTGYWAGSFIAQLLKAATLKGRKGRGGEDGEDGQN